jgi:uncharacterized protein YoxC
MALDKEIRISELSTSGSKAIKSIDDYGRHNYYAEQMAKKNGSMDGEMSGRLRRTKYDEEQLLLAVDTVVDELIGDKPKDLPAVVLKSVYDDLKAELDKCLKEKEKLLKTIANLRAKISELESTIDGLKAELDASLLRVTVAENTAEALGDKFAGAVTDLQQAIQKSVSEAIERVSLEAQVEGLVAQKEALIKQLTTLEEQLQGKSAEVGAGAESSGTKFTARVTPKGKDDGKDFEIVTTKKSAPKVKFHNGPDIILLNTSEEPVSFTFSVDQSWLKAPSALTIQSGETKTVALSTTNKTKDLRPHGWGGAKDYNGTITITGGGEPITLEVHLRKNKKGTV